LKEYQNNINVIDQVTKTIEKEVEILLLKTEKIKNEVEKSLIIIKINSIFSQK
jgi:hypothetical protein